MPIPLAALLAITTTVSLPFHAFPPILFRSVSEHFVSWCLPLMPGFLPRYGSLGLDPFLGIVGEGQARHYPLLQLLHWDSRVGSVCWLN